MLGIEAADSRTSGMLYVAFVQSVLFYVLEMWVMSPYIGGAFVGFHYRLDHILTGWKLRRGLDGTWV